MANYVRLSRILACSAACVVAHTSSSTFIVSADEPKHKLVPVRTRDGAYFTPWSTPTRAHQVQRLKTEEFDLLVVGGGATGAGIALDASYRGLNVGLVERDDFSAGTSSRSTKLIHGGIRYLEAAFKGLDYSQYKLVHEALAERAFMINSAPYLARPLPIMIPIYKWYEAPYMWVGAKLYDMIAGYSGGIPPSRWVSREEALYRFPMLKSEGLKGAVIYYDGQHDDARMNLHIILTAAQANAAVTNYVEILELIKEERNGRTRVVGAKAKDKFTGEQFVIRAKAVINATGAFVDEIRHMDNETAVNLILPSAGVHLALPDHFSPQNMGLIIPRTKDGRVLFLLPWQGVTLCGTTDSRSELTMTPKPTRQEVGFILEETNRALDQKVHADDVRAAWSGIRPLALDPKKAKAGITSTAAVSREHVIEVSDSGLVTVTGGKWTTFRQMAEDAVNAAIKDARAYGENIIEPAEFCTSSSHLRLIGADRGGLICAGKFSGVTVTLREEYGLDKDLAEHLTSTYGTRAYQVAEIASKEGYRKRLHSKYPFLEAEVVHAVREDYAMTVIDVLARRTRLAFMDSQAAVECVPRVTEIMASMFKWDKHRKAQEMESTYSFIKTLSNPLAPQPFVPAPKK